MTKKQIIKRNDKQESTYQYLDINRLNSYIQSQDYPALIAYASTLRWDIDKVGDANKLQYENELRICENLILDYFLSLQDEKLLNKLLMTFIDDVDLFPDVYEKVCAKLIDNKTPEKAISIYKKLRVMRIIPSQTILNFIATNTKKADTCLYFIDELEKNHNGTKGYDKVILEFYNRFRAVCTKEDFEKFIESGMQNEKDLQKQ